MGEVVITAAEIRAKYPAPVVVLGDSSLPEGCYCVGGALCLFTGHDGGNTNPSEWVLTLALENANHRLDHEHSKAVAKYIIEQNDLGNFDDAWDGLDAGLKFGLAVEVKDG